MLLVNPALFGIFAGLVGYYVYQHSVRPVRILSKEETFRALTTGDGTIPSTMARHPTDGELLEWDESAGQWKKGGTPMELQLFPPPWNTNTREWQLSSDGWSSIKTPWRPLSMS